MFHVCWVETGGWRIYQTGDWDYRWEVQGGATIHFEIGVGPVVTNSDGSLTQAWQHVKHGSGNWKLDPQTLKTVGNPPPIGAARLASRQPRRGSRSSPRRAQQQSLAVTRDRRQIGGLSLRQRGLGLLRQRGHQPTPGRHERHGGHANLAAASSIPQGPPGIWQAVRSSPGPSSRHRQPWAAWPASSMMSLVCAARPGNRHLLRFGSETVKTIFVRPDRFPLVTENKGV